MRNVLGSGGEDGRTRSEPLPPGRGRKDRREASIVLPERPLTKPSTRHCGPFDLFHLKRRLQIYLVSSRVPAPQPSQDTPFRSANLGAAQGRLHSPPILRPSLLKATCFQGEQVWSWNQLNIHTTVTGVFLKGCGRGVPCRRRHFRMNY